MGQTVFKLRRLALAWAIPLLAMTGATALAEPIESSGPVKVPMRGIAAGTFYVEADIAGFGAVEFLVDTGSGYTAIGTGMLEDLASSTRVEFVKDLEGIMADGSRRIVPVYRIPEIQLGSCSLKGVEVAVFGAGTRPILGMRALSRVAPFTFSTNPPGISLSRCDSMITAGTTTAPAITSTPLQAGADAS